MQDTLYVVFYNCPKNFKKLILVHSVLPTITYFRSLNTEFRVETPLRVLDRFQNSTFKLNLNDKKVM